MTTMGKQRSDGEPGPADIDELRRELARKAANIMQAWRTCRRPLCKRGRRCAAHLACAGLEHRPLPPEHKRPAIIANVYRQLKRAIAARQEPGSR
jgi:hypothetical protein